MALAAESVSKRYEGLQALDRVSIVVEPGQIVGLIGPNGAGKTTLFELMSGLRNCDAGHVRIDECDATQLPAWDRCRRGLGRTFQIARPLGGMSVLDNAKIGAFVRHRDPATAGRSAAVALERVGLTAHGARLAADLTLVEQKRLEIARVLATEPRYLLLDECFAGLRASEQDESMDLVRGLAESGIGLLLIEHSMRMVMKVVDRVIVLHHGRELAEGAPTEVAANPEVQRAYLGSRHARD